MPPLSSTQKAAVTNFMSITGVTEKVAQKVRRGMELGMHYTFKGVGTKQTA